MSLTLTGKDILKALNELKVPATINDIVDYLSSSIKGSKTNLLEAAKVVIDAGVRFGCIVEESNLYRCEQLSLGGTQQNAGDSYDEEKLVKSAKELNSTENINDKTKVVKRLYNYGLSSDDDDDELNDNADCNGPSYRRRRSRSRSSKRPTRSSKRRSRRRRSHA